MKEKSTRIAVYMRRDMYNSYGFKRELPNTEMYKTYVETNGGEFAGLYVDDRNDKDRPAMARLLADCCAGKVDMIITKSTARFARNVVTLLETVRELKELNIDVYFEREKIHSIPHLGRNFGVGDNDRMGGDFEKIFAVFAEFEKSHKGALV